VIILWQRFMRHQVIRQTDSFCDPGKLMDGMIFPPGFYFYQLKTYEETFKRETHSWIEVAIA